MLGGQQGWVFSSWADDTLEALGLGQDRSATSEGSGKLSATEEFEAEDEEFHLEECSERGSDAEDAWMPLPSPLLDVPPTPLAGHDSPLLQPRPPPSASLRIHAFPQSPMLDVPPSPMLSFADSHSPGLSPQLRSQLPPAVLASLSAAKLQGSATVQPPALLQLPLPPPGSEGSHRPELGPLWGGASESHSERGVLWGAMPPSPSKGQSGTWSKQEQNAARTVTTSSPMSATPSPAPSPWARPWSSPASRATTGGRLPYAQATPSHSSRRAPSADRADEHSAWIRRAEASAAASGCTLRQLCRTPGFTEALLQGLGLHASPHSDSLDVNLVARKGAWQRQRTRFLWKILRPPLLSTTHPRPLPPVQGPTSNGLSRYSVSTGQADVSGKRNAGQTAAAAGEVEGAEILRHSPFSRYFFGTLLRSCRTSGLPPSSSWLESLARGCSAGGCEILPPVDEPKWQGRTPPKQHELSLSSGAQEFVLYEYMEEFPPLLPNVGMAHRVLAYYMPEGRKDTKYRGPELGPLFGEGVAWRPVRLVGSQPLPLLGRQVRLRAGQGLAVMESTVMRAPIFRHAPRATDFLLVRSRHGGGELSLRIRRLLRMCAVGQTEPLLEVSPPTSKQAARTRRNCVRQMAREVHRRFLKRVGESRNQEDFLDDVLKWWPARDANAVRAEVKESRSTEDHVSAEQDSMSPEDVCVLESMRRGEERLQSLGVEGLLTSDKSLRKAMLDLEALESRPGHVADPLVPRVRWVTEQLQLTPWHLTGQYTAAVSGQRLLFGVSGPGDPSGGRGEGVSFLPAALTSVPECLELAQLQRLRGPQLRSKLLLAGFPEGVIRPLCRWEQLSLLYRGRTGLKGPTAPEGLSMRVEQKLSSSELRRSHERLLQETFDRQIRTLSGEDLDFSDVEGDDLCAEETPPWPSQPVQEDDDDDEDVEEALLNALNAQTSAAAPTEKPLAKEEDDEGAELERFRAAIAAKQAAASSGAPGSGTTNVRNSQTAAAAVDKGPKKVRMLRVVTVEKNPTGRFVERVLYVFGADNIELYRRQADQAAMRAAEVAAWTAGRGSSSGGGGSGTGGNAKATSARGPTSGAGQREDGASSLASSGGSKRKVSQAGGGVTSSPNRPRRGLLRRASDDASSVAAFRTEQQLRSAVRALVASGDLAAAADACERAVRDMPGLAEPWFLRGFVHDVAHEHEPVAKYMRRALALDRNRVDAWLFLSECEYRDGNFQAAFEAFDEVRSRDDGAAATQAAADAALLARNLRCVLVPRSAWSREMALAGAAKESPPADSTRRDPTDARGQELIGRDVGMPRPVFEESAPPAVAVWDDALSPELFRRVRESIDDLCVWRVKSPSGLCTFWLPREAQPKTAAEVAGRALLKLLGHKPEEFVGIEWWCRNQSAIMGAHFHYDTALSVPGSSHREVEERTDFRRPTYSSVLYLGDVGGPTVVLDQVADRSGHSPPVPHAGCSVATKRNRYLAFPGELRHGGVSFGSHSGVDCREPRFVILYNFWKDFAPGPPACQTPDFSHYRPVCSTAPTARHLLVPEEAVRLLNCPHDSSPARRVTPSLVVKPEEMDHSVPVEDLPTSLPMPSKEVLSATHGQGVLRLEWGQAARQLLASDGKTTEENPDRALASKI
ncbi:unnamed protein product, partial [Polarella glacialis]